MSERPSHYAVSPKAALTARQREVLALVARGYTNGQIAEELGISLDGAKFHVSEILERLHGATREKAVRAWNEAHSLRGRTSAFLGALMAPKVLAVTVTLASLAVVAGVGWGIMASRDTHDEPTVADVVQATQKPGKALYLEFTNPPGSSDPATWRMWYASDLKAARMEVEAAGALEDLTLVLDGRGIDFNATFNTVSDTPARPRRTGAPDGAVTVVTHIALLLPPATARFVATETRDGQRVYHFESVDVLTGARASDRGPGTIDRYQVYLRTDDLLPVAIEATTQESGKIETILDVPDFVRAEFVDLDGLPKDLFDAGAVLAMGQSAQP